MTETQWSRLCAGVHWMRHGNRDAYALVMRAVKADGGDVQAWNADVKEAAANGLVITPEREPQSHWSVA